MRNLMNIKPVDFTVLYNQLRRFGFTLSKPDNDTFIFWKRSNNVLIELIYKQDGNFCIFDDIYIEDLELRKRRDFTLEN